MTNLSLSGYGEIRVTEDGAYSVFDVIEYIGGKSNPRDAWKSLCEQYSEVVGKTYNFKFPGKGQRETPVANKPGILHIIGLLPGAVGRSYREDAAKMMLAKMEGRSLDVQVIPSQPQPLSLNPAPALIGEAIAAVFCLGTVHPSLVQGLIANEIGKAHPALKPQMDEAKRLLPLPVALEERPLTVTEVAGLFAQKTGISMSPVSFNKMLLNQGFQVQNPSKEPPYLPTEKGKQYGQVVLQTAKNHAKTVQQLRWSSTLVDAIAPLRITA